MKKILHKLRSAAGESLVETLCAILVATLSLMTLSAIVATAARMNRTIKAASSKNTEAISEVKQHNVSGTGGTLTITDSAGYGIETMNITVYTSDDYVTYTAG